MSGKNLVTDSLFIFDEHVKQLEEAGYKVARLDKPKATGEKKFEVTKSLEASTIGVIGAGNIGRKIVEISRAFGPARVLYFSRTQKGDIKADYSDLDSLLSESDVIFLAVPESVGLLLTK